MGLAGTHAQVSLAITLHHEDGVWVFLGGVVSLPSIPGDLLAAGLG